jgi:hypothetical protein
VLSGEGAQKYDKRFYKLYGLRTLDTGEDDLENFRHVRGEGGWLQVVDNAGEGLEGVSKFRSLLLLPPPRFPGSPPPRLPTSPLEFPFPHFLSAYLSSK